MTRTKQDNKKNSCSVQVFWSCSCYLCFPHVYPTCATIHLGTISYFLRYQKAIVYRKLYETRNLKIYFLCLAYRKLSTFSEVWASRAKTSQSAVMEHALSQWGHILFSKQFLALMLLPVTGLGRSWTRYTRKTSNRLQLQFLLMKKSIHLYYLVTWEER